MLFAGENQLIFSFDQLLSTTAAAAGQGLEEEGKKEDREVKESEVLEVDDHYYFSRD